MLHPPTIDRGARHPITAALRSYFGSQTPYDVCSIINRIYAALLTVLGIDHSSLHVTAVFLGVLSLKSENRKLKKQRGVAPNIRRCGGVTDYGLGLLAAASCCRYCCSWVSDAQRATAHSIFSAECLVQHSWLSTYS